MKNIIFILCLLLISLIGCASDVKVQDAPVDVNPQMPTSDAGVQYDAEIIERFSQDPKLSLNVIVRLRDNSGIIIKGTKYEKIALMKQQDEWFKPKIDEVLSSLSQEDFKLSSKLSNGFQGTIKKGAFDELINNVIVGNIIFIKGGMEKQNS